LINPGSCAGMWFRFGDSDGGYALQICEDGAYFVMHHKDTKGRWTVTDLFAHKFDKPMALDETTRFTVTMANKSMTFYRADQRLGTWADATFTHGRICIGVLQRQQAPAGTEFSVGFSNVQVWGASPAEAPISSATSRGRA
jgi:hypothetical protein